MVPTGAAPTMHPELRDAVDLATRRMATEDDGRMRSLAERAAAVLLMRDAHGNVALYERARELDGGRGALRALMPHREHERMPSRTTADALAARLAAATL